jgi:hypothetical protein
LTRRAYRLRPCSFLPNPIFVLILILFVVVFVFFFVNIILYYISQFLYSEPVLQTACIDVIPPLSVEVSPAVKRNIVMSRAAERKRFYQLTGLGVGVRPPQIARTAHRASEQQEGTVSYSSKNLVNSFNSTENFVASILVPH